MISNNLIYKVVNFVKTLKVNEIEHKLYHDGEVSLFASIFALYIYDLTGETKNWDDKTINDWSSYINSFQDEKSGLFHLENPKKSNYFSKSVLQLTAFSLSALEILNSSPRFEMKFIYNFNSSDKILDYLNQFGCLEGKLGSGNYSMFLAIFLTWAYKNNYASINDALIENWFELHNKSQNAKSGFWGKRPINKYYWGFQNSFHQFVIYDYWNRTINFSDKIVTRVLSLQDKSGHFAMIPGGGSCWDYDASHILCLLYNYNHNRKDLIKAALKKLYYSILKSQNADGGFCENKLYPSNIKQIISYFPKIAINSNNPIIYFQKSLAYMKLLSKKNRKFNPHWSSKSYSWETSELWSTWFRLLTLAEIEDKINSEQSNYWHYQKLVGIGFNRKNKG